MCRCPVTKDRQWGGRGVLTGGTNTEEREREIGGICHLSRSRGGGGWLIGRLVTCFCTLSQPPFGQKAFQVEGPIEGKSLKCR